MSLADEAPAYGGRASQAQRQQISALIDELAAAQLPAIPTKGADLFGLFFGAKSSSQGSAQQLGGTWRLVYTTEGDVHKLAAGLPLGLSSLIKVQDIWQDIYFTEETGKGSTGSIEGSEDSGASDGRVTNTIEFAAPFALRLQAGGPMTVESERRIRYKFDFAALTVGLLILRFPPRGGGWTEACYVDEGLRVMRNSRGDTLVLQRVQGG